VCYLKFSTHSDSWLRDIVAGVNGNWRAAAQWIGAVESHPNGIHRHNVALQFIVCTCLGAGTSVYLARSCCKKLLELIEDLHSTLCLWDPSPSAYKDRNKKLMSCLYLDKKFRTLKSQIRRECKKLTVSVTTNRVKRLQKHGHWTKGWCKWNKFILSPFAMYLCTRLLAFVGVDAE
jgi:hypothetical protein